MTTSGPALKQSTGSKCLIPNCENEDDTRGLCGKHHKRFLRVRKKLDTEEKRVAYEDELIARGMILKSGQGKRVDVNGDDEFLAVAAEMELIPDYSDERARRIAHNFASAAKKLGKKGQNKQSK